ncbi:MAG: hypothetical protein ACLQVN_05575 [Bryobacteraceae bacterium]
MRILGWILLIVGIVFELLVVMARLGGGNVGPAALLVGAILISLGWSLTQYWKGTVTEQPTSVSPSANSSGHHPALAMATQEMTMTLPVVELVARELARTRRLNWIVVGCIMGPLLLIGAVVDATTPQQGTSIFRIMAAVSAISGAILGGLLFLTAELPLRRDLREPSYLRTSGPIQLVSVRGGILLRLADRAFFVKQKTLWKLLHGVSWATVEYSRHGHVILEVRDEKGQSIWRDMNFSGCGLPASRDSGGR